MKKIMFVCSMLLVTMAASAQFTMYRPVEVPQRTYTPSPGYGTPFTYYKPVYGNSYQQSQQSQPKMREVTLRGYYVKGGEWHSFPIRVGVVGDEILLLSTKGQYGWTDYVTKVSEVGEWDSEIIRDNFIYKAFLSYYGHIYF